MLKGELDGGAVAGFISSQQEGIWFGSQQFSPTVKQHAG